MTTILLTGKTGQVGWELRRSLASLGQVIALDHNGMDLANPDAVVNMIRETRPNIIVNAAAYTAVDKAEAEPDLAMAVNGLAPGIMAEEAKKLNATLVHFSTDYVFDGLKTTPYDENDVPNPLNVYGRSKLAGERAVQTCDGAFLIFRTAWVYGMRGKNFVRTVLRLAAEHNEFRIVDDQFGTPTWSRLIAETTATALIDNLSPGIYHLTATGATNRYHFAQAVLNEAKRFAMNLIPCTAQIVPIASAEYPSIASRPRNSVLSIHKLETTLGVAMPDWEMGLRQSFEQGNVCAPAI